MQQALPRPDALLASARCGMAVVARDGAWLAANPALCRLLGADEESLLGVAAHRTRLPASAAQIDAVLEAPAPAADHATIESDERLPSGNAARLSIHVDALRSDDPGGSPLFLLQVEDVTASHHAQVALALAHEQQEHLAFGFSHDLRASLRSIEGFAGQLGKQPLDAQGQDYLGRIRDAAGHGGRLVDALVQLSRAATTQYADEVVDISLLALWVAAELQDAEQARAANVVIQPGLSVRGDERYLRLMLQQLLHNAWKFAQDRERVEITVEGRAVAPGRLMLSVRDNGEGFDMEYAEKLFLPFKRLHGSDRAGGHGLGLSIAQTVARRHGGRITAQSEPGAGSVFSVELPAGDAGREA